MLRARTNSFLVAVFLLTGALASAHGGGNDPAPANSANRTPKLPTLADYEIGRLKLGGDFTLTNQDGEPTNLKRYRGRVVALFFGYTYCPDVCPVTMAKVAQVRKSLGKLGPKLQPIFVSIDPERDTPARLKSYVSSFGGGIVALTGSADEITHATGLYRARFEREDSKDKPNYLMAHTAYLYLLDGSGKLRYVFPPDVDDGILAQGTRLLLRK